MIRADFATVERLAAELCALNGGDWSRKRTKRNLWRRRIMALIALANGDKDEAHRAMTTTRAQGEGNG